MGGLGIYRRQLDHLEGSSTHYREEDKIVTVKVIYSIAIDHINYRIFYANASAGDSNTMMSANFDGSDIMGKL